MHKADLKPGEIYAYQRRGRSGSAREPIVFLTSAPWVGALWREARAANQAFTPARGAHRPQAGNVGNSGSIGYPAVLLPQTDPSDAKLAVLRSVTFADFRRATSTWDAEREVEFLVVTSLPKVLGPWPA